MTLSITDILHILRQRLDLLRATYKVRSIGVFGSYARETQHDDSDIDVLVEFVEPVGWEFFDLQEYLRDCLGKQIDLVTPAALKPTFRNAILHEVRYA